MKWAELWPHERAIALAVRAGLQAEAEPQNHIGELKLPVCRGAFIAQLLQGEASGDDGECIVPKTPGASIKGYRIEGPINLIDQRHAGHNQELKPLLLENCEITHPLKLAHAHIARLAIVNCRWRGLNAEG